MTESTPAAESGIRTGRRFWHARAITEQRTPALCKITRVTPTDVHYHVGIAQDGTGGSKWRNPVGAFLENTLGTWADTSDNTAATDTPLPPEDILPPEDPSASQRPSADRSPWLAAAAAAQLARDHTAAVARARWELFAARARVILLEDGHTESDGRPGAQATITGFYVSGTRTGVIVAPCLRPDYAPENEHAATLTTRTTQYTALLAAYRRTLTESGWTVTERPVMISRVPILYAAPPADHHTPTGTTPED